MKKLILINGTMGVGKTSVSQELFRLLAPSAFLDGDWCWNMNPFAVNAENKQMVIKNIGSLLRSYLKNSSLTYVIFCWVMHREEIIEQVLSQLEGLEFEACLFTLLCSPEVLEKRLKHRMQGEPPAKISAKIAQSAARLPLYSLSHGIKIDVSSITPLQAAESIAARLQADES